MMGFGSFGHGGSSSLSSLSPLAPPFTFDRSLSVNKPNPTVHSTEESYSYDFNSSVDNWLHLHPPTSVSDSFSKSNLEGDLIHVTGLPSATAYGYFGAQSMSSLTTRLPSVNPITTPAPSGFSYSQHLESVTTNLLEAEPYYPQYTSKPIHETSSSAVLKESDCDILSTSCFAPLEESSRTDYSHNLSGLGYTSQWGGFWNGLPDGGQERIKELDGSLRWKEINGFSSSGCNLEQGSPAGESLTAFRKAPGLLHRECVDMPAGKSHIGSIGTEWVNYKCLSGTEENILSSNEVLQEMSYPRASSPISVMKSWRHLSPKAASNERCFTQLDSCKANRAVHPSATHSSSAIVSETPTIGISSSALKKISPKNIKFSGPPRFAYDDNESNLKEPSCIELNGGGKDCIISQINNVMGNDHLFVEFSSMKKDGTSNHKSIANDALGHLFKVKSDQQVTHSNLPDAFVLASGDFVENSSETFDSPCWKGASINRHSPFRVADAVKELECNDLNLQGPQISLQEQGKGEHGCFKDCSSSSSVSSTERKIKGSGSVGGGSYLSKFRTGNGIEYSDDSDSTKIEDSRSIQSGLEDNLMDFAPEAWITGPKRYMMDAGQDGSLHAMKKPLSNSLGGASNTWAYSVQKTDVRVLVNAIHNLSELLLSSSKGIDALMEQDLEALRRVINKLDMCVQKKLGVTTQIPESRFSKPDDSYMLRKFTDLDQEAGTGRSQVRKIKTRDIQSRHDYRGTHEGRMHYNGFNNKDDKLQDISLECDVGMEKDKYMTQAIEKVLTENFDGDEELHPQTMLYKNLWLEAEAALCSMNYKARYARMKIEMEKFSLHQEREKLINEGKSPNSKIFQELKPEAEEGSTSHVSIQKETQTNITGQQEEDVEASVMARFHILKCQVEKSSSLNKEAQLGNAIDARAHAGAVEQNCSPGMVGIQNAGIKSQPTNIVNLSFGERRKQWPFLGGRWEDASLEVRTKSGMQHHGPDDTEDDIALGVSKQEFSDAPVIQSYYISSTSRIPVSGYDSPSSDWEHVQEEEIAWQNSGYSIRDRTSSNP